MNTPEMDNLRQSAFRPFSKIWGSEDVRHFLERDDVGDINFS